MINLAKTIFNTDNIYPFLIIGMIWLLMSYLRGFSSKEVEILEVLDGDTVKVLLDDKIEKVRLMYIDAPELEQTGGNEQKCINIGKLSKFTLKKLIKKKTMILKWKSRDRYKRILGFLISGNKNLNFEMIKQGQSVVYWFTQFYTMKDKIKYLTAQSYAMKRRVGIWEYGNFYDPYKFRKKIRKKASTQRQCSENHFL